MIWEFTTPDRPPLVPDGFFSLGVERFIGEEGRLSDVLWEEEGIIPQFVLEVVSKTYKLRELGIDPLDIE